jgi:hypothetical protein
MIQESTYTEIVDSRELVLRSKFHVSSRSRYNSKETQFFWTGGMLLLIVF